MRKVYIYLLNTMADWEIGHISAELNSRRFFKKDAEELKKSMIEWIKDIENQISWKSALIKAIEKLS